MRLIAGLAAACTLTALTAVPAVAAKPRPPAKVCNLIVDDAGDAIVADNVPSDDSQDILGGDFASNGKKLTGVVKLKGLANPSPQAPFGQAYFVLFTLKGSSDVLTLTAGLYPTGNQFTFGYQGNDPNTDVPTSYSLGAATGKIVGNSIYITADIAKFPQAKLLKNGNQVTTLTAEARRVYGQRVVGSQEVAGTRVPLGGATLTFDEAVGKKYTLGASSCVPIG